MNLIRRIKNLWKLSEFEFTEGLYKINKNEPPKRELAQIIKRKNILDLDEIL
jgi:hypothetical protein